MDCKIIDISDFPKAYDMDQCEKEKTFVLNNLFSKFINEHNANVFEAANILLKDYVYVDSKSKLWPGRYVMILNVTNPLKMKVSKGGFLLNDDGNCVTLKNGNSILKYRKRNYVTFMLMNDKDKFVNKLRSII